MKIKIDENLPKELVGMLRAMGHDVDTVQDEGLASQPDHVVWMAAQQERRLLMTQDLRWSDTREYRIGTHHGIFLLRLDEPDRASVLAKIQEVFSSGDDWAACHVVVTDKKVRVKRPG